ncbi:MAG: polysaccharide pyruvyl transferase family protein [Lachnospiraceae bacterium]|nr:polysaccharide pyruvyl transferase family protein [Lachnospiraceae bacterium]
MPRSPVEFLEYLYYSDYVITGSFHAVCFSLLFKKDFISVQSPSAKRTGRIKDLLTQLTILEETYQPDEPLRTVCLDYGTINQKLVCLREDTNHILERIAGMTDKD